MRPLSIIFSIKSNLRRYLNQVSAIILSVFIMYFFCVIGGGIEFGIEKAMYTPYEDMSFITGLHSPVSGSTYNDALAENPAVDKILYTNYNSIMIDGLIGGLEVPFITLSKEDINYVYNKLNFKMLDGSLPSGNDDILINKLLADQFHLKVGDYFGKKVNQNQRIDGKYRISGIYEGNDILVLRYNDSIKNIKNAGLMILSKKGRISSINSYIDSIHDDNIVKIDLTEIKNSTESAFQTLKLAALFIMLVVGLVVTVIISNISYVNFLDRLGELSILYSMGYKRGFLVKRLFTEMGTILSAGGLTGILLSILGSYMFKVLFCEPRGLLVRTFDMWYVFITFGLIALVILLISLPISKFIRKTNMGEVLEGNY